MYINKKENVVNEVLKINSTLKYARGQTQWPTKTSKTQEKTYDAWNTQKEKY